MALITNTSDYLTQYNYQSGDLTRVTSCITAAQADMERYCRRYFESAARTQTFRMTLWGDVLVNAWPITSVTRILWQKTDALTVTCSATGPNYYSVTDTGLTLGKIVSGTTTETTLTWVSYPTLTLLAAAMPSGFSATVSGSLGSYPSADLVAGQIGSANATLQIWSDSGATYKVRNKPGIISLFQNQFLPDNLGQSFAYGGSSPFNGLQTVSECKVTWTGGYASNAIPADLQEICAVIAANVFNDRQVTASNDQIIARLPVNLRETLSSYRDRGF